MSLSKELIGELQVILREEYGKSVSIEEAAEIGRNLVRYFSLLAKIEHRTAKTQNEQPPNPRGTGPP